MLSYPQAKHARFALLIVAGLQQLKIISLCSIISLVSYILRVRFGGRVRRKPKLNMFQLGKSLKVGQTTILCHPQDHIFFIFRQVLCLSVLDLHWILSKAFVSLVNFNLLGKIANAKSFTTEFRRKFLSKKTFKSGVQ